MTRAASLLLRVVGLALVLVGLMGFALLGADGTWTARAEIPAGRTAVLLEPSVVSLLGPSVTVRVHPAEDAGSAPDTGPTELFLGRGRSDDLTAYAQDPKVTRVVGLTHSRELDVRDGPGPVAVPAESSVSTTSPAPTDTNLPARWRPPTAVDLWQQQVSGPQARELMWRPTRGAQSVLVAAEAAAPLPALDVEVSWTDHTWLWIPAIALLVGIGLIGAGLVLGGGLPAWAGGLRLPAGALGIRAPRRTSPAESVTVEPGRTPAPARLAAKAPAQVPPETPAVSPVPAAKPIADDLVPTTRRAARGRRRKQTVWQRARSRARAAVPAGVGAARSGRNPDGTGRRGEEGGRS